MVTVCRSDHAGMRVVEHLVVGKHPDPLRCEDAVVVEGPLVAVIDGETDKSGKTVTSDEGEVTSGRFAARVLAGAIRSMPSLPPFAAVAYLSGVLDTAVTAACGKIDGLERPAAAVAVFDSTRRVVWRVGDCPFRVGDRVWDEPKRIDRVTGDFRAAYYAALTDAGKVPEPADQDPGRAAIMPLLRIQTSLTNVSGEFGYGMINGTPVPQEFVTVVEVPDDVHEIVLASDGYPTVPRTLSLAEAELLELLEVDPLCVGPLRSTKGLVSGMRSYDDRCWVRVRLD